MNKVEGSILYTNQWAEKYQRNNKRSGVKNLRCFPCCSQPRHMEKGYCGQPVSLSLKRTPYLDQIEIFAWAEFKTIEEIPRVRVGSTITAAEVKSLTRSRMDIYKPWYRGEVVRTQDDRSRSDILVLFNTSKKGWNYNWAATRNSALVKHVLMCYVCTLDEYQEGTFRCISIVESPHFTIACRKQNVLPLVGLKKIGASGNQESFDDDDDDDEEGEGTQNRKQKPTKRRNNQNPSNSLYQQQSHMFPQMQQRSSQSSYVPDLEFFNDVDAVLDSKDEYNVTSQDSFDPIKSLFSTSSMSNLFLPSTLPAANEIKYGQDSHTIGWISNSASDPSSGPATKPANRSIIPKKSPILSSSRLSFGDDEDWKKLLSSPAAPPSQNYNWGLASSTGNSSFLSNVHNSSFSNLLSFMSGSTTNDTVQSSKSSNITGNKRKDLDSSSNSSDEDIEKQIIRLCILLDKIEEMLKEHGAASKMGVPQFALEEFLLEIGNVGFDDENVGSITPLTGSMVFNMSQIEPITYDSDGKNGTSSAPKVIVKGVNATKLVEELMGFLLNESQITASFRTFANNKSSSQNFSGPVDERARKLEFINVFNKHLATFLASKDLTFADLDKILQVPKKDASLVSKALKKFEEQVRRYVEDEDTFEKRKRLRVTGPYNGNNNNSNNNNNSIYGSLLVTNPNVKTIDLTGEWRLDDTTLEALDSLRVIRGLPWFIRQVLTFMEKKIIVEHLPDRLLVRLNRKLLSTGFLEYLLDNQPHDLNSTGPLPWSRPVVETYRAWIDGDTFRFIHTYESNLRSERCIRKNATGDRLEVLVNLQEKVSNNSGEGQWKTIVEKTGYALRGTGQ